jgi:hypothetical protein
MSGQGSKGMRCRGKGCGGKGEKGCRSEVGVRSESL